jgi:hypothetical protein
MGLNLTVGMDVRVYVYSVVCCPMYMQAASCGQLISRPRSPRDCVYDTEAQEAAKTKRAVESVKILNKVALIEPVNYSVICKI